MKKEKILITGGAGFIGKNLANRLSKFGSTVLIVDNLSSGNLRNLDKNIQFKKIDILDYEKLKIEIKHFKPDIVFHLAALNMRSKDGDNKLLRVNVVGTLNVLKCIRDFGTEKIIFASSASVYGNAGNIPTKESSKLKPINIYGESKMISEILIKSILEKSSVSYSILRLSNVYGPGQRSDNEGGVVPIFCKLINNRMKLTVHNNGKQTRDFIYIDDVVNALCKSINYDKNVILNISSGTGISINKLVEKLTFMTKNEVKVVYKLAYTNEITESVLDNVKARKVLNWKPLINLDNGIEQTYKLFK